jgi:hypothetical protein
MKKVLLSIVMIASITAFAQRSIDWQTVSIDEPSQIVSGPSSTSINLLFTMKNNGPDTVMPGDSVLYRFALTNTNPQILFPGPTAATFRVVVVSKEYAPDDTMQISMALSTQLVAPASFNANLNVTTILQNTGSLVDSNTANGAATRTVVWFNQYQNPVGLNSTLTNGLSVKAYPNPANAVFNIELNDDVHTNIAIYDITGKLVYRTTSTEKITAIEVSNLNKGIYLYEVRSQSNEIIKTGKFSVAK